jgi:hypothetical protein
VPPDTLRVVTDQWEWANIARLAPTVYHEQSWTLASVIRLRTQLSVPISFGYVRVWAGDSLIGCPMIRVGDRWFNTPRAAPLVLVGPAVDPMVALADAKARQGRHPKLRGKLELHDDTDVLRAIARTCATLEDRCVDTRRYRTMSGQEIDRMARSCRWASTADRAQWIAALKATWRAGCWVTEVHAHYDDAGEPIGYTVWVTRAFPHDRGETTECIGAIATFARAPAWCVSR